MGFVLFVVRIKLFRLRNHARIKWMRPAAHHLDHDGLVHAVRDYVADHLFAPSGNLVSNRMNKTIVVQVVRRKSHPLYTRVISKAKKFYAHDEKNEAHIGDVVRLEETRPLSKLKRWRLKEVVRKTALVPEVSADVE